MDIAELEEPVFRVIVNHLDGSVIVGARNALYRLNSTDLSIEEKSTMYLGPFNQSADCLPPPSPCQDPKKRELVDNDMYLLMIKYDNSRLPLLFGCGTASHGSCWAFNAFNVT